MGSRCTVYLTADPDEVLCYHPSCVSSQSRAPCTNASNLCRSMVELGKTFAVPTRAGSEIPKWENVKSILLDGETLPWRAMGESSIDETYGAIKRALGSEIQMMQTNGFESALRQAQQSKTFTELTTEAATTKQEVLRKKYGNAQTMTMRSLNGLAASTSHLSKGRLVLTSIKNRSIFMEPILHSSISHSMC